MPRRPNDGPDATEPATAHDGGSPPPTGLGVYRAIHAVMSAIGKVGINKGRENKDQKYMFRGIDQVYEALSPILAEHGLLILPRVSNRTMIERESRQGSIMSNVTVDVTYDLVSAEDGSRHQIATIGEGTDTSDKATNKAMSAAYKYACIQAFCIPLEGEADGDAETVEHGPRVRQRPAAKVDDRRDEERPRERPRERERAEPAREERRPEPAREPAREPVRESEPAGPTMPDGYPAFRETLGNGAAVGLVALNTAWKAGTDEQRAYLDAVAPELRKKLKALAITADEKRAAAAQTDAGNV